MKNVIGNIVARPLEAGTLAALVFAMLAGIWVIVSGSSPRLASQTPESAKECPCVSPTVSLRPFQIDKESIQSTSEFCADVAPAKTAKALLTSQFPEPSPTQPSTEHRELGVTSKMAVEPAPTIKPQVDVQLQVGANRPTTGNLLSNTGKTVDQITESQVGGMRINGEYIPFTVAVESTKPDSNLELVHIGQSDIQKNVKHKSIEKDSRLSTKQRQVIVQHSQFETGQPQFKSEDLQVKADNTTDATQFVPAQSMVQLVSQQQSELPKSRQAKVEASNSRSKLAAPPLSSTSHQQSPPVESSKRFDPNERYRYSTLFGRKKNRKRSGFKLLR